MTGSLERAIMPRLDALEDAVCELRAELAGLQGKPVVEEELYLGSDFGENQHNALVEAGFDTNAKVKLASDEELLAVRGIGPAMLRRIRSVLR